VEKDNFGKILPNSDNEIANVINEKYGELFEYTGGCTGIDGYLYLKCKQCDYTFKYTAQITRPSRSYNIRCSNCIRIKNEALKEVAEEQRIINKEIVDTEKQKLKTQREFDRSTMLKNHICEVCGNRFEASRLGKKYCAEGCRRKSVNRYKEIREKDFRKNGRVDNSITLEQLIIKDKSKCRICGKKIDKNDCRYDGQRNFIVGNRYPTIDHIKARANGGTHTWDNVQLAHLICNSSKNDSSIYKSLGGQLVLAI